MTILLNTQSTKAETCIASIYSTKDKLQNGTHTASGRRLNDNDMTAAHKTLPFGYMATITYGLKSIIVMITDRGPFVKKRCIDLTPAAGRALGISGLGKVTVE